MTFETKQPELKGIFLLPDMVARQEGFISLKVLIPDIHKISQRCMAASLGKGATSMIQIETKKCPAGYTWVLMLADENP